MRGATVALAGVLAAVALPLGSAFHLTAPPGVGNVALRASRSAFTSPRTPGFSLVAPRLRGGVLPVEQHAGRSVAARRQGRSLAMQAGPEVEEKEAVATDDAGENAAPQVAPISFNEEGGLRLFGIDATAEVMAISLVYFVQGILGISRLAVSFYYKDTLHIGPGELAMIQSIQILPWVVKPLYGFLSDGFPLFGYKRRSYLILSGIVGSASWAALSALAACTEAGQCPADSTGTAMAVAAVTLSSLGLAFSDVLVDAMVVARSRGKDQSKAGSLQALCWSSSSIGGILSAYASGTLVQEFGSRFVFGLTALFPLVTAGVGFLIAEEPVKKEEQDDEGFVEHIKEQGGLLWGAFSQKQILLPAAFLVLWQSTPSSGSALFFFETNELGFKPEFLGQLALVSNLASLAGIVLYDQKFKRIPLKILFRNISWLAVVLGMSPLILVTHLNRVVGLPDTWFALGDDVVLTVLGQVAFMPVLVLGANLCPPGVEASLYAALMSLNNLSGGVGGFMGGLMTKGLGVTESDFSNLPLLIVITNLSGLLPLPFLFLLPKQEVNEFGELITVLDTTDEAAVVDVTASSVDETVSVVDATVDATADSTTTGPPRS